MKKEEWKQHIEKESGLVRPTLGGSMLSWHAFLKAHKDSCPVCKKYSKQRAKNSLRSIQDEAARACGLVKVRGAVSGKVYYE